MADLEQGAARGWDAARPAAAAVRRYPSLVAALLLLVPVAVFLWPVLLGGEVLTSAAIAYEWVPWQAVRPRDVSADVNLLLGEPATQFYPWREFAREQIHAGALPQWNPYALTGTPLLANAQLALFSPFSLPLWLLPLDYGLGVSAALILWVGSFGMYLLIRRLGLGFAPALLGAVAFGLAPFTIMWLRHPVPAVFVLLPWALWAAEGILREGRARDGALLAAALAVAFTGGHPGTQIHALLAVTLYAALRLGLTRGLTARARLRRAGVVAGAAALAVCAAAVALLPAALLVPDSAGEAVRSAYKLELGPEALRTLLFPDWWGGPRGGDLRATEPPFSFSERTLYAGGVVLVLAAVGLAVRDRWRDWGPFALLGLVGLWMPFAGPPRALVDGLPILGSVQNQRLLLLFALAAPVLAAFGLERFLAAGRRPRPMGLVLAGAALLGLAAIVTVQPSSQDLRNVADHFATGTDHAVADVLALTSIVWWLLLVAGLAVAYGLRRAGRRGPALAVVFGVLALDVGHFARGYVPMTTPDAIYKPTPPVIAELERRAAGARLIGNLEGGGPGSAAQVLPADTSMLYGLRDVRGHEAPEPSAAYLRIFRLVNPNQLGSFLTVPSLSEQSLRITRLLGARWILQPPGTPGVPGTTPAYDGPDARLFEDPGARPRAWLPPSTLPAASEEAAFAAVAAPEHDPATVAVVETPGGAPVEAAAGEVRITEDGAQRVELRADLERGGLVVLADAWKDGWSVEVDGHPAEELRVDTVLRGVWVPAGTHTVTWSYLTPGLVPGAVLSAAGIAGIGTWLVLPAWRRRSRYRARPR